MRRSAASARLPRQRAPMARHAAGARRGVASEIDDNEILRGLAVLVESTVAVFSERQGGRAGFDRFLTMSGRVRIYKGALARGGSLALLTADGSAVPAWVPTVVSPSVSASGSAPVCGNTRNKLPSPGIPNDSNRSRFRFKAAMICRKESQE